MKIAVIGSGPMGLAAAYKLKNTANEITIFESDSDIGGMSAFTNLGETRIEKYYHFICKPDTTLLRYISDLNLEDRLHWAQTKMGFFYNGELFKWGDPISLLLFPKLSLIEKIRYGMLVMQMKMTSDWSKLDKLEAIGWLKSKLGERAYNILWDSLFHFKFYNLKKQLSAAWLGTRIKRVALSRKNLFSEEMGYLEGGSETVLKELYRNLINANVKFNFNARIERINPIQRNGEMSHGNFELIYNDQVSKFDAVISTIPLPYLVSVVDFLPQTERDKIASIKNVGVVCVLIKLKNAFTENFWLNINDPDIEIPGLIEYSNLNPMNGEHFIYAPYYMPQDHPKFSRENSAFIQETIKYMKLIKSEFSENEIIDSVASRYEYSQTVCHPNFFQALPSMKSALKGFYLADTSHYYPEDRSISESFKIGEDLADLCLEDCENFS